MKKAIRLIVATVFLLLTLSACYKLDGKAAVNAETDTVSGEISVALNKAVGQSPPSTNLPTGVVAYPIESKSLIGYKYVLTDTPVSELQTGNTLGLPLWITKNAVGYGLSGDFSKYSVVSEDKDAPQLPNPLVNLSISLPNPITAQVGMESTISGGIITLTSESILTNPVFIFAPNRMSTNQPSPEPTTETTAPPAVDNPNAGKSMIPNFGDEILPDPRIGVWPIPLNARSPIPSLVLWAVILLGAFAAAYGHITLNNPQKDERLGKKKKKGKKKDDTPQ